MNEYQEIKNVLEFSLFTFQQGHFQIKKTEKSDVS